MGAREPGKCKAVPGMGEHEANSSADCEQAHRKALRLAKVGRPSQTEGGEWRFAGISLLLPVYDELEDGAEILWTERGTIGGNKLKRLIKSKKDLSVFDDRDGA